MLASWLTSEDLALDVLRMLILLEGGIVLGLSVFVFRLYLFARRMVVRSGHSPTGAPPYHVALIAVSHALLVIAQLAIVADHIGQHLVWFGTPIALVAFTLSLAALLNMLHHENLRIQHARKITNS